MSDVALVALISGVISAVISVGVVIVNLYWNYRTAAAEQVSRAVERQENRREWYRQTLFEKRLSAVQEAHAWSARLRDGVALVNQARGGEEDSHELRQRRTELSDSAKRARAWWDENNLFLTDELQRVSSFVGLTNTALQCAGGRVEGLDIKGSFREVAEDLGARTKSVMSLEEERSA